MRKLLAVFFFALGAYVLAGGFYSIWTDNQYEPALEPAFLFAVIIIISALVFLVSYILWPKRS